MNPPMSPAYTPDADNGFEGRLIPAIRPIADLFLATSLQHFFQQGIYDHLTGQPDGTDITRLADSLDLDIDRTRGFLRYLANENVVTVRDDLVALTALAHTFAEFRSWYTFLVGGYQSTVQQVGDALRRGSDPCTRNGEHVGVGSCEIARYDGIPMTRTLLSKAGIEPATILDLGCGDGSYLIELCKTMPNVHGWGVEPDEGSYEQGRRRLEQQGLQDRVTLVNLTAEKFLAGPPVGCDPDVVVFGYVLQELLGQRGEVMVTSLLSALIDRFPQVSIVVIEVADQIANPTVMRHGLARNFWNLYYLVHYFTSQRLASRDFWEAMFARASLQTRATCTTPVEVDSTCIELGYLLTAAEAPS